MKRTPKTKEDFAWVNWAPADIEKEAEKMLAQKKERYSLIKAIPATKRTFENTIYAIESSDNDSSSNAIYLLLNVSSDASVRKASKTAINKIQEEYVDIEYDIDLHRAVKEFANTSEAKQLIGPEKKLFSDMVRAYRRMGFELLEETRELLKFKLKELQKLENDFDLNINNYDGHIFATKKELDGLSENYIASLKKTDDGRYVISAKTSDYMPFIENASNAEKRKEICDMYYQKGGMANIGILKKIISLRQDVAELLGYANYVDYITEVRMAKTSNNVSNFLEDLRQKSGPLNKKDLIALTNKKRVMTGNPKATLEFHDVRYYMKQLEKELFNFDMEKIREYFPFELVKKGFFKIFGKLFSIEFEELSDFPVWHPDVTFCAVKNSVNHNILGYLFFDLYPRDNKYSHAAHFDIVLGGLKTYKSDEYQIPVATMVANFAKPNGEAPSLLSHGVQGEIETFFHEFGHVLHHLLTTASYTSQSGTAVTRDFVEVPSQLFEEWIWDKKLINLFSGHYLNHADKIPSEMLNNLISAKKHMAGYITMRQLFLGIYNHTLHVGRLKKDILEISNELHKKFFHFDMPKHNLFPAGLGHLVGYGGAYYSYMWSEMICSDMFTRFKKEGLLNPIIGKEFRNKVLAIGSSRDETETVKDFLGREPNNKAFLEELGIKE